MELLIVWHSRTGAARQMAEAAADGAGHVARLAAATETTAADLLAADAYLFAGPENLGSLSGMMKDMFDRCYYPVLGKIEGRPFATIIAAGSAGQGAQAQIDRIAVGWRLKRVAEPLIVNVGAQTEQEIMAPKVVSPEMLEQCRNLGAAMAEGLALGIF